MGICGSSYSGILGSVTITPYIKSKSNDDNDINDDDDYDDIATQLFSNEAAATPLSDSRQGSPLAFWTPPSPRECSEKRSLSLAGLLPGKFSVAFPGY